MREQEGMWKDYQQKRKRKSSRGQKYAIKTNIPEGVCTSTLQIASMVGKKCHYTTHKSSEKENVFLSETADIINIENQFLKYSWVQLR